MILPLFFSIQIHEISKQKVQQKGRPAWLYSVSFFTLVFAWQSAKKSNSQSDEGQDEVNFRIKRFGDA